MSECSPADDRFSSCWQKLDRAREHAEDLVKEISDFWAANPLDIEYVTDCQADITQARITRLSSVPHRLFLSAVVALNRIELHGDSYELMVVKKYSGFRLDGPLPMEPLQWTPVKDKSIIKIPMTAPEFGGTETGLIFNLEIAEVECLRRIPVTAAMTSLANSVEDIIRRLAPLA